MVCEGRDARDYGSSVDILPYFVALGVPQRDTGLFLPSRGQILFISGTQAQDIGSQRCHRTG